MIHTVRDAIFLSMQYVTLFQIIFAMHIAARQTKAYMIFKIWTEFFRQQTFENLSLDKGEIPKVY